MGSSSSIKPQLFHGDCTLSRPMSQVVIRNCDLRGPLHSLVGPAGLYYDIYSYLLRLDLVRLPGTVLATGVRSLSGLRACAFHQLQVREKCPCGVWR